MVAGGRLCSRYFLNCAAGLPARCQGAALASRRTSSFAAKPCTWLGCSFPRFLCQAREGERQDLWAHSAGSQPLREGTHSGLLWAPGTGTMPSSRRRG